MAKKRRRGGGRKKARRKGETGPGRLRRWLVALVGAAALGALVWLGVRWFGPQHIVAPRPAETADTIPGDELGELDVSSLSVPIRVRLGRLLEEVEEAVPTRWGSLNRRIRSSEDSRTSVAVALSRGPFRASFRDGEVRLGTTVSYRVRGWYDPPLLPELSASCGTDEGQPPPRLVATLEGPLTLTPDWTLSTRTEVGSVTPASDTDRDRCRVTFVKVDMTGRVIREARSFLQGRLREIDGLVGRADVRSSFEEWWGEIRDPIRLDDAIWLELRPQGIRRGEIRGLGNEVEVTVSLLARPRVVLGLRPVPDLTPLPPLETGGVEEGGLDILVEGTAQYDAMSERVSSELEGLEPLRAAGREVRIERVAVSGIGGGRVAVEVRVSGDVKGRLFLVGTPRYDPETGYTSVPDLTFAAETSSLLLRGASWVSDAGIERLLRARARWRAAPAVDWLADKLREGLNRELTEGVRLEGTVEEVRILGVRARKNGLVVRAAATADARLLVEKGT